MKNVLKTGFLALGLGLFLVACGPTGNNGNNQDSGSGVEQQAPEQTMPGNSAPEGAQQTTPPPAQDQPANDTAASKEADQTGGM